MGLSVVLPCYNEAISLPTLIHAYEKAATDSGILDQFQLIIVDNGSSDDTEKVLSKIRNQGQYEFITIVTVTENQGYGYGVLMGLQSVRFNTAAYSHADEQCSPLDVFRAYDSYRKKENVLVKGHRTGRAFTERLFTWGFELCVFLVLGKKISEINAQPKLFPSRLISQIEKNAPKHFAFDLHVLLCAWKANLTFEKISVIFPPRVHGVSRWASTLQSKLRNIRLVLDYLFLIRSMDKK